MDATVPTLLLSTGCLFHLPLPRIAAIGRASGFAGLDLVMGSPRIRPGAEVAEADTLCPVRVVHAPFRNWSAWGGHMNAWRAAADLAGSFGRPVHVTLHPPAGSLSDAIKTRWFAGAVDLPRLLGAQAQVDFSLENLPWPGGGGLFAKDLLAQLVSECRTKDLGLTLDVCHLGVSGRDPCADLARVPQGMLRHVHFSDATGFTEHVLPGAGELPLGPFLAELAQTGFAGTVSLELDPEQLPQAGTGPGEGPEGNADAECIEALADLKRGMEQALAGQPWPGWRGCARTQRPTQAAFG